MSTLLLGGLNSPHLLTGGLGPAAIPVVVGLVPDPRETSWTLTPGGSVVEPTVAQGFDLALATTLKNNDVPVPFDPSATLSAKVWRGLDEPVLFSPAVAWIDATLGTLRLFVPRSATTGRDPGLYRMQVAVTTGGGRYLAYDHTLEVTEGPGSRATRTPYVTGRDLAAWYDQLPHLQNLAADDATFLAARVRASDDFDRMLVTRYDPRPGFNKIRQTAFDAILGYDVPSLDADMAAPSPAALSGYVKSGGVVVDRNVSELVSKLAIADILERQEVISSRNGFRDEADRFRVEVDRLWRFYDVQIDTDDDGIADLLVGRDAIILPSGTAP